MRTLAVITLCAMLIAGNAVDTLAAASCNDAQRQANAYLLDAAAKGNAGRIRYLLERGADPEAIDPKTNLLAIQLAVQSGNVDAVKVLMASGDFYKKHPPEGGWNKNDKPMREFVTAMRDMPENERRQYLGGMAVPVTKPAYNWENEKLFVAARNGDTQGLHRLLSGGADPNAADENGHTPLGLAAREGHQTAAAILLAGGADLKGPGDVSSMPIAMAGGKKQKAMEQFLADMAAMPPEEQKTFLRPYTPKADGGRQALYPATGATELPGASSPPPPPDASGLGDKRFDTADRRTVLMNAASRCDANSVRQYIREGADVNGRDAQGETPLFYAVLAECPAVTRLLLNAGADPNARNRRGFTLLTQGLLMGAVASAELLVANGADVNALDGSGNTALLMGVGAGDRKMIDFLLGHGADVNKMNADGASPLAVAVSSDNVPLVKTLVEQHKADIRWKNKKTGNGLKALVRQRGSAMDRLLASYGLGRSDGAGATAAAGQEPVKPRRQVSAKLEAERRAQREAWQWGKMRDITDEIAAKQGIRRAVKKPKPQPEPPRQEQQQTAQQQRPRQQEREVWGIEWNPTYNREINDFGNQRRGAVSGGWGGNGWNRYFNRESDVKRYLEENTRARPDLKDRFGWLGKPTRISP